jgi:hypothetical protein
VLSKSEYISMFPLPAEANVAQREMVAEGPDEDPRISITYWIGDRATCSSTSYAASANPKV